MIPSSNAKEAPLPNLTVYRYAWAATLVIVIIAVFTLGTPGTPLLSDEPASFDGDRAMLDVQTLCEDFPQRVAGSDTDIRSSIWLLKTLERQGLKVHIDSFTATIEGENVPLQNVYAVAPGDAHGTIVLVANRDSPPGATQGAGDNASGTAALLELARTFTVTAHDHSLLFLWTDGDAYGALGARDFVMRHPTDDILAVIALRDVGRDGERKIELDGWSPEGRVAPPWLWLLSAPAAQRINLEALLPGAITQVLRLAVPTSAGSQAPFVAAGLPALSISSAGPAVPPEEDTLDSVTPETLMRTGRTAETMVQAIDVTLSGATGSGGTIFLTRHRTLPGASLAVMLAALFIPLGAVTFDLFAQTRRRRIRLRGAWQRLALHVAPWMVVIVTIYVANFLGLLPRSPGAFIPPTSDLVDEPRYLRVALLLGALVVAYLYAVAVERRLRRRLPVQDEAIVFVAHAALLLIALAVLFLDPYSLLLVAPAGILWPLARPGPWPRSILTVYLGLSAVAVAVLYFASHLELGAHVWWYFFLLVENRTVPASVTIVLAVFLATAGMLAHALHVPGSSSPGEAPSGVTEDGTPQPIPVQH